MSEDLKPLAPTATLSERLRAEIEAAQKTMKAAHAKATLRAYASDWVSFCEYCEERNFEALPAHPDVVALYLERQAHEGRKTSTVGRRLAAINRYHRDAALAPPSARDAAGTIATMLKGIRNTYGSKVQQKAPAEVDVLTSMLATIEGMGLRAVRDRAVLAIGFASALRRSELVAVQYEEMSFVNSGLRIFIPRSKGDQGAQGTTIAVPNGRSIRPVNLLRHWLHQAGHTEGPVFRRLTRSDVLTDAPMTDKSVARRVKAAAAAAGFDPALSSAHSLRAGFLTSAAASKASLFKMKDHARHKSLDTVAGYVRDASLFDDHAGDEIL